MTATAPAPVAPLEAPPPELAQQRWDGRARLTIEGNLGDAMKLADVPRSATPGEGRPPERAAALLFDHVMASSGLNEELTQEEREAFLSRFVTEVTRQCAEDTSAEISSLDFMHRAGYILESQKPVVTAAIVRSINSAVLGFTTKMQGWMVHESVELFQRRLGRTPLPEEKARELEEREGQTAQSEVTASRTDLPASFDAREEWPECADVIGKIHNQGHCGSCWVFGAVGPLDSRLCIKTRDAGLHFAGDQAMLSRGFATSCAVTTDGCLGGWEYYVYDYIERTAGLPPDACSPYFASGAGVEHFDQTHGAPSCPSECDASFPQRLAESRFKPSGVGNYRIVTHHPTPEDLEVFRTALYEGGPVAFGIYASRAFMAYSEGIFGLDCGHGANHAVHAIGWGPGYFLGQNSWSDLWGDGGRFKVAPCVPSDFTIPGDITETQYPLPIPSGTRTTTTTTPEPAPDPASIPCNLDEDGCWTSPNWPEEYGMSQECIISFTFGKIDVKEFDTEPDYDVMEVNGQSYSGRLGPHGVVPITNIRWFSDYALTRKGWKICPFGP